MNLKKPNFWDQKTPNLFAYLLLPIALIIKIFIYLKRKPDNSKMNNKHQDKNSRKKLSFTWFSFTLKVQYQ